MHTVLLDLHSMAWDILKNIWTMHMRMALEDTVIIEFSTLDDDSDSHIVEDGKKYVHVEDF